MKSDIDLGLISQRKFTEDTNTKPKISLRFFSK
jgi:hypothetical protein